MGRLLRRIAVGLVATLGATVVAVPQASAFPGTTLQLNGHGYGHGRGLSQYGSLGYALGGWTWSQILDHYYGGTAAGTIANVMVDARLTGNDGGDLIVTSQTTYDVAGHAIAGNVASLIRRTGGNAFTVMTGPGCAGPWTTSFTTGGPVVVTPSNTAQPVGSPNLAQMVQRCEPAGQRAYRGVLRSTDDSGTQHAWSELSLEDYLRGVVPRESPASWGDAGGGAGMNALKAQAVAARSYATSPGTSNPVTTCDSQACQVYGGTFLNGARIEDDRANAAVDGTAGQVRRMTSNGQVARTEFSSSSGGYTAGGTFPAVEDAGDATGSNGNHTWTASVGVGAVEAAYPSIGSLQSVSVVARNGLGDWGGRVTTVSIVGSSGSVTDTGAGFRSKLNLKSDWFQVVNVPSGGVGGYWMLADDGGIFAFGDAQFYGSMGGQHLNKPIVGMAPTSSGHGYWLVAADGGIFSYGDAQFYGSMGGRPLNKPIVGMAPTSSGHGYWLVASDGGIFAFGDAQFYGSMGGRPLNSPVVGMTATSSGHGYWLVASDGGIFAFGDAQFYGSMGGQRLARPVKGIAATPSGNGYWMVGEDGGVFAFGGAGYFGSLPGSKVSATASSISPTATGSGYLISSTNGVSYSYGDAPQFGYVRSAAPGFVGQVIGLAPTP